MSKERLSPNQFAQGAQVVVPSAIVTMERDPSIDALYAGSLSNYKRGSIINGTIMEVTPDGVLVDIGFKSDGRISLYEFNEHELKKLVPGSSIEIMLDELENADGSIILSYEKAKSLRAWQKVNQLFEENKPVEGIVTHKVKGGMNVDIGIPAFLPGSQIDVQRVADFDAFIGQPITAYIIKLNPKRGNAIISRRKYLSEQRAESRKKVLDVLEVGQVIRGTVKNITNYGVFIDIGGVDGLLHITDMTWGRISHPSELVKLGDEITVKVLTLDKENEKISLGMKQLHENPWQDLSQEVTVGQKIKGTIASITDYGMFIEVAKGVEGLVHISEVSWTDRIADLHQHYSVGQEIEAVVVSIDRENRRMSLSIKQLEDNPWDVAVQNLAVGQRITGQVSNTTDFGVFVTIAPGIDGLIHISDLSWTEHVKHPADVFKKGDTVEAIIIDINRAKRKISLGIKQLTENPWDNLEQKYPINSSVKGEVTKITDFGAFIKLESGIEGLIHISELASNQVDKVEDILKVGQHGEFRVIKINEDERRVGLSLKTDENQSSGANVRKERGGTKTRRDREEMSSASSSSNAQKPKSQFQIELERLAARKNESIDE